MSKFVKLLIIFIFVTGLCMVSASAEKVGELVSIHVIPRPHADVETMLPQKGAK